MLADVDGHLIPSGAAPDTFDAFETILPQWVPARLWRRGMELEGYSGLMGFSTLGLRPEGSAALCPRELDPLERDYLRLNPLENPLRVDLRPFPPRGCLFGAAGVMRASMGDAGGFLRHSGGGIVPGMVLGWGVVDGAITLYHGTKKPGEEEVIQGGVVAGARRIPVQNPAGARGSGLVGRDLLALRPSGWSTGFLS